MRVNHILAECPCEDSEPTILRGNERHKIIDEQAARLAFQIWLTYIVSGPRKEAVLWTRYMR
jgi:hypothetical protein